MNLRRQGVYFGVAAMIVAVAAVVLWRQESPSAVPQATSAAPAAAERPPSALRPTVDRAAPAPSDPALWYALEESSVPRLPDYATEWSTEGRVLVSTAPAMAVAGSWRVGDRLTLPVPQLGVVYHPLIEEIDDGPGGSRSVLGMVRGEDGRDRRYVVTVGPAHVFAYVDTPRGPYELSGGRELGWLLPTSSMMAGFDFSEPDYILPETHEMH